MVRMYSCTLYRLQLCARAGGLYGGAFYVIWRTGSSETSEFTACRFWKCTIWLKITASISLHVEFYKVTVLYVIWRSSPIMGIPVSSHAPCHTVLKYIERVSSACTVLICTFNRARPKHSGGDINSWDIQGGPSLNNDYSPTPNIWVSGRFAVLFVAVLINARWTS